MIREIGVRSSTTILMWELPTKVLLFLKICGMWDCACDLNQVQIMIQLYFVTEFNDDYECDLNLLELGLTYAIECAQVLT